MFKQLVAVLMVFGMLCFGSSAFASDDSELILKILIKKGIITQDEVSQMRQEIAVEKAKTGGAAEAPKALEDRVSAVEKDLVKGKPSSIPEWTQKLNVKGDVRFRTQTDWGKGLGPAHSEVRERVRARIGVEAKVNDQIYGGVRVATGGSADPRSPNITLGNGNGDFSKTAVMFDQYYIRYEPHYQYLEGAKFWLGKFPIPFDYTELFWDPDLNPEGIGVQYLSPSFRLGGLPETKFYSNDGMFWLQEIQRADTDPMLWAAQAGIISQIYPDWGTSLNIGAAYYDVTREKNRNWTQNSAGTNSLQTAGDAGDNRAYIGTLRYDYNMLDLLVRLDNKKIFDIALPQHGLYGDLLYNADADSGNTGYLLGIYLGEKKIKEFGQWYTWFEWRYLGRDCAPDIMPDSDFFGFSTAGVPGSGGTNAEGFTTGLQFGLFKDTYLGLKWIWSEPVKSTNSTNEWYQIFQADVNVKF